MELCGGFHHQRHARQRGHHLPEGALLPAEQGFERGLSAERYYRLLQDRDEQAEKEREQECKAMQGNAQSGNEMQGDAKPDESGQGDASEGGDASATW